MALTEPKLYHSTWRMFRPSTVIFILLSVSIMVEGRRCYWCGPLAEQVHRSRRATPCDSPEDHVTTCEPGLSHCALVATSPPYVESRLCVKIYQDECYPLFCNSTKTWKMTCPCRGDLCNGFTTERETEAFAYLSKLVKKTSRIKRAAATPKYINRNEKMLIEDDNDEDNSQIRDIDGIHSDIIVMPTSDYVPSVTNIYNIQHKEVSVENSEQPSSMNAKDNSKNDDKMEISDNDKINMNDAEMHTITDSSNTDKEDGVPDMDVQSEEHAKPVEENDNVVQISHSVPKTNSTEEMKEARNMDTSTLVENDKADGVPEIDIQSDDPGKSIEENEKVVLSSESSSPKTDSSEEMKEARSMGTESSVTISQEMLESKHVTEAATIPPVVIEKPLLSDASNIKPSGEPPTAEALSQNFSPTEQGKMEKLPEKKTEIPPQTAIPTEKTPVATLEHTSSTVKTFAEVTTTKPKKNNAVILCTHIYNYILSWITLYFFI